MAPGLSYTEPPSEYFRSSPGIPERSSRGVHSPSLNGDFVEPIAVVGLSLKFPQDATTPESFWNMLREKRCAMTEIPEDRLNVDSFRSVDKDRTDTVQACSSLCPFIWLLFIWDVRLMALLDFSAWRPLHQGRSLPF